MNNISNQYGPKKLANILGFKSLVTLENYLGYLTEAYLIFSLKRYSTKVGIRLRSSKKTYAVDNGFVTAKAVQHSPNSGKLLENLVFTELVKKGNQPNRELFYYKTRNDREIDFVLKKGYEVAELIQVVYELTDKEVEGREVKALVEAGEELNVKNLTVITWNEKKEVIKNGMTISFIPLWEWLIEA